VINLHVDLVLINRSPARSRSTIDIHNMLLQLLQVAEEYNVVAEVPCLLYDSPFTVPQHAMVLGSRCNIEPGE